MDTQNTPNYEIYEVLQDVKFWSPAEKFDFDRFPVHPAHLSNSLQMTLDKYKGVAISAPQVNIPLRVIYIKGFESALFNPRIVDFGDHQEYAEEVSLSYPDLIVKIKRADVIRVRFADHTGEIKTQTFMGLTSRAIQRKMSFLDGEPFYKRATQYHLEQAKKKRFKNVYVS